MFDVATAAVEGALGRGGHLRRRPGHGHHHRGACRATDGILERVARTQSAGVGVRALVGSSWGFFAVPEPSDAQARKAGHQAAAIARASAMVPGPPARAGRRPRPPGPLGLGVAGAPGPGVPVREGRPAGRRHQRDGQRRGRLGGRRHHRRLGHREVVRLQPGPPHLPAPGGVRDGDERHRGGRAGDPAPLLRRHRRAVRHPGLRAGPGGRPAGNARRIAEEAVELLHGAPSASRAPSTSSSAASSWPCRSTSRSATPSSSTASSGWEAAFAGTSFLDLAQLGTLRYGSELMNITADATLPGALGSFGYDDEGTPAQRVDIVQGRPVGRASSPDGTRPPSPACPRAGWSGPTATAASRWCG